MDSWSKFCSLSFILRLKFLIFVVEKKKRFSWPEHWKSQSWNNLLISLHFFHGCNYLQQHTFGLKLKPRSYDIFSLGRVTHVECYTSYSLLWYPLIHHSNCEMYFFKIFVSNRKDFTWDTRGHISFSMLRGLVAQCYSPKVRNDCF